MSRFLRTYGFRDAAVVCCWKWQEPRRLLSSEALAMTAGAVLTDIAGLRQCKFFTVWFDYIIYSYLVLRQFP